ncbi:hypothetical protein BGX38DRAFT_1216984 [Terfezia claveryi]|nr:hypothetical protein BGX38DRAFT_1216984 [Terfezia claveryi]
MFVILIGLAFLICRKCLVIGLVKDNDEVVDMSFDILSLEALVLIPRTFSLLTLHPYFGVLIPCLKQMTKDFCKFMILVVLLFLGFLSTFSILGRDKFSMMQMAMLMTRVFLGETSHGFDTMGEISPILGPPLMLIFIILTNILLITSLISLLSNNLTTMMNNAREEYLFMYSTFIMGSVTSNRLTYFYPPLNLIPLIFLRPLRLFLTSTQLRRMRIALLKFTHFPLVKQLATINRKNQQRLLARPPVAPIGGFARAASVSHGVSAADRETRRMREIVGELNLKLDALLAKQ